MKISFRHRVFIFTTGLLLSGGLINYYYFQPHILLFGSRHITGALKEGQAPFFLSGYLSDLLWCAALYCCIVFLAEINCLQPTGRIALLLLPFITEFFQYGHFIGGTADPFDLLLYAATLSLFILLFPRQIFKLCRK